ncbi:MAG: DndE family protein [Fluviicola sp.]|nr:DndE family protein [Fluviicola sp.]
MFSQIRTSKENKEVVSKLTRRLSLGTENVIARIAYSYSLSKNVKLDIKDLTNSSGKEYSKAVLFGDNINTYIGMICTHYNLYKTDKDIPKYVKLHLDHGLQLINSELEDRPNVDGFDFLVEKITTI